MAETPQYYKSRHKGNDIDNAIDNVEKHSAAIKGLADCINQLSAGKADKVNIPTSIVDLLQNPALTWIGEDAPKEPYYNVWVYMPKNDAVKIYVRGSVSEPWIDTGCDNILFIKTEDIENYSISILCDYVVNNKKQIVVFDYVNLVQMYPVYASQVGDEIVFASGIVDPTILDESSTEEMKIIYLRGIIEDNKDKWVLSEKTLKTDGNDGEGSDIFIVKFNSSKQTANKSYDEILDAIKQHKVVMLYEGEDRYLATFNSITPNDDLLFVTHDIYNIQTVTEYICNSFNEWAVVSEALATTQYVDDAISNIEISGGGGTSIKSATIDENQNLIITQSDDSVINAGSIEDERISKRENVKIGLGETVPDDTISSICDFEVIPVTQDVYYSMNNSKLTNVEYKGIEVPVVTTTGDIVIRDSEGNEKYRKALPFMLSRESVSDKFANDGLYKAWSNKFYINKAPTSMTTIPGRYSWNITNYLFEFNFTEDDFALTGIPPKKANIPITTTSFVNMNTNYILEGSADGNGNCVSGNGIARANLSWDSENAVWTLLVRTNHYSTDYFSICSKTYMYYELETPYTDTGVNFAMGLSSGDIVTFESNLDYFKYLSINDFLWSHYKRESKDKITSITDDVMFNTSIPMSLKKSSDGFSNVANILNNVNKSFTSTGEVNSYGWIGNADESTDYTSKIQKKLDDVHNLGGGTVYLGNGNYNISSPLIVYNDTNLVGDHNTNIVQSSDNTHAIILSGSNITLQDLSLRISGNCSDITGCVYVNSNNTEMYNGEPNPRYDSRYPINTYVQYCTFNNVSFSGIYGFDYVDGYPTLGDKYHNYKGCGIVSNTFFFNYTHCNNCDFKGFYCAMYGIGGANYYNVTYENSKYCVIDHTGGDGHSEIIITGHTRYAQDVNNNTISTTDKVAIISGENHFIKAYIYDSQWLEEFIEFTGLSMRNKYIIESASTTFYSNPTAPDGRKLKRYITDYGRGNQSVAYFKEVPFHIGARYQGISGQTSLKVADPITQNALAGAGIWGSISSEATFDTHGVELKDICRYPKSCSESTIPYILSSSSPSEDTPIEITIDVLNRPITTFPNIFIQFDHNYIASKIGLDFYTNGSNTPSHSCILDNSDVCFYYSFHQGTVGQVTKIKLRFMEALTIDGFAYQNSAYKQYTIDYNPEKRVGICNIGMVSIDGIGRSFLGECGGSLYGNVDMHSNTLKNLPLPKENGDVASKEYVDSKVSGGGSGESIMFVEIAEIFESDHFRYEFARPFEEIRDWLMNGGYVIGKVGSEDICGITYYATAWDADTVWFSNFIKATSASTSEHTELIFSQDESVEIRSHSLVGEEAISADNEDFKTAVLNCFPDADTMSFPLEETVSEVNEE